MKRENILLVETGSMPFWRTFGYDDVYALYGNSTKGKKLPCDFMKMEEGLLSNYKAGQIIDWVYGLFVDTPENQFLAEIMADEQGGRILKKALLWELGRICHSMILAEKFRKDYGFNQVIDFIPRPFFYALFCLIQKKEGVLPEGIRIPQWYLRKMKRRETMKSWIYAVGLALYPVLIGVTMSGKPRTRKEYSYAVHMWDSWISTYGPKSEYRMQFLEGSRSVSKDNALYFIDQKAGKENIRQIQTSGYECCYFKNMVRSFNGRTYWKDIYPQVRKHIKALLSSVGQNGLFAETCFKAVVSYIHWKIFFHFYGIKVFLYVQDPCDIAGTLLQKRHKARNVFIYYSTQYDCVERENMNTFTETYYGHMMATAMISSRMSNDYFRRNNELIGDYRECGLIWSDIVFAMKNDLQWQARVKKEIGLPSGRIVLGVFTPGIGRAGCLTEDEGFRMIDDIYRLIESNEQYCVVLRYRQVGLWTENGALRKKLEQLIDHERVFDAHRLAPKYQAYQLMGCCDLVIGGFASSVPMESVAGGIRTVCYVPERLKKNVFVINSFPKFCPKDFKQLNEYVHFWLDECDDRAFADFQDAYVKPHVDSYCDGQATKRLGALLAEIEKEARGSVLPMEMETVSV
ncbi:MAG: hypothetical protein JW847_09755 [Candidatus Omnitrophica bacterium]|nr:hypothetical protein [Candidatus Omnitrophota bacterium]